MLTGPALTGLLAVPTTPPTTHAPTEFTDPAGHRWRVVVSDEVARLARRELNVNLLALASFDPPKLVDHLFADHERTVGLLWLTVADQAEEYGVSPEAFARLLIGPKDARFVAYGAALLALLHAVASAYPSSVFGRNALQTLPLARLIFTDGGRPQWQV